MKRQQSFLKKILSMILIAVTLLTILAGCSEAGKPTEPATETTQATENKQEEVLGVDRNGDTALKILMVGNSFCYYYVEELYELLMEKLPEGVKEVEIFNLYYSGCNLSQHFLWWMQKEANYQLFKVDASGRQKLGGEKLWTLEEALAQGDWDYISLQGKAVGGSYMDADMTDICKAATPLASALLGRFHELYPKAQLLWHSTWFSEVGRVVAGSGYEYKAEDGPKYNAGMLKYSQYMCNEFDKDKPYDLKMVNSGAAWTKARELNETRNLLPYGGLCARLGYSKFGDFRENSGDGYHDGDIGGAQLLNAYVWYMTITGDTDLSHSTYAPVYKRGGKEYPLSAELIAMLKEAAMTSFGTK